MTFEHYWSTLVKQWKLILICFLVVGVGTYVVSRLMTPLYQSVVLIQVAIHSGNNQSDINSLLASDQLVQTEAQLAVSDPVFREVASHHPDLTVDQLYKNVSSTPRLNTQLFEIAVLDPKPQRAADIANDIAATLIKQQQQVLDQENSQSQQQIQQDIEQTRQQIDVLTSKISALQAKGGNQEQIALLQTQLSGLQQHYDQWQTALAQLELAQAQSGDFLRVVQAAQPALAPVRPSILLNTSAGLVGGLFLGILLAVLFEQLDTRVRTPEALTQLLDWPVLGTILRARTRDGEEVINPSGHNANVESYRILRTNIGFSGVDKPLRFLMVTSAMPRDGKSTIAANLAIFLAKAGKNTLLIDADLRRPTVHEKFGLAADKMGLSNAILACAMPPATSSSSHPQFIVPRSPTRPPGASSMGNVSLEPFMHALGIPNLRIMPSGPLPPNPSELLDSKAMQRCFTALEYSGAEVVIFDTPPLIGLSDASILASRVDGTIVVFDIDRANKGNLTQVKTLLTQANAHVLGCVVNKQRRSRHHTSYSYYYYYHRPEEQGGDGAHHRSKDANSAAPANILSAAKVALLDRKKGE